MCKHEERERERERYIYIYFDNYMEINLHACTYKIQLACEREIKCQIDWMDGI